MERSTIQPKKQGNTKNSENRDWGWESWTEFEKEWGVDIIGFFSQNGRIRNPLPNMPPRKITKQLPKKNNSVPVLPKITYSPKRCFGICYYA